jgi:hypothetical protein
MMSLHLASLPCHLRLSPAQVSLDAIVNMGSLLFLNLQPDTRLGNGFITQNSKGVKIWQKCGIII